MSFTFYIPPCIQCIKQSEKICTVGSRWSNSCSLVVTAVHPWARHSLDSTTWERGIKLNFFLPSQKYRLNRVSGGVSVQCTYGRTSMPSEDSVRPSKGPREASGGGGRVGWLIDRHTYGGPLPKRKFGIYITSTSNFGKATYMLLLDVYFYCVYWVEHSALSRVHHSSMNCFRSAVGMVSLFYRLEESELVRE